MAKEINQEDIEIKENFEQRYKLLLGNRYDEFIKYSLTFLRRAIRVNTLKIEINSLKQILEEKGYELTPVPWCKEGFWIKNIKEDRWDIGNLIEHKLGFFYIQEPASMIPPLLLELKDDDIVLDVSAAPGSKTTQIGMYMNNKGIIVANDLDIKRLKAFSLNIQRSGLSNTVITSKDGRFIKGKFDKILLDAPCSGVGTIRKSLKTLKVWNPKTVTKISILQKQLLENNFNNLKKGGIIIYSTCSLEPEENEGVVDFLLKKYENAKLEEINLPIKKSDAILEFEGQKYTNEVKKTMRLYPQDNDTQGFFIAKIRKI